MDRNLTTDSVSLGLNAIKVSETKAVVPFDKRMESEMQEAIVNMVSRKFEVESEEEKIQRLVNHAKGQTRPSDVARLLCVLEQRGLVVVKKEKDRKVNTAKSPNTGENSVKEVPTQPAAMKQMKLSKMKVSIPDHKVQLSFQQIKNLDVTESEDCAKDFPLPIVTYSGEKKLYKVSLQKTQESNDMF